MIRCFLLSPEGAEKTTKEEGEVEEGEEEEEEVHSSLTFTSHQLPSYVILFGGGERKRKNASPNQLTSTVH